jgi:FkbM family methyltransferase
MVRVLVRDATTQERPKAGFTVAGRRVEAELFYRLKQRTDHPRAVVRNSLPASLIVFRLTWHLKLETRRRLQERGWLRYAGWLIKGGSLRIPYGAAEGMALSTSHIDLAGAQTFHVVRGTHELMVQEALRRTLGPGMVLYDIGANIGFFSLIGARLVGHEGQVVALDPEQANVRAIERNAALNVLPQVVCVRAAAVRRTGPTEIVAVEDSLWTRVRAVGGHSRERDRLVVDGITVDDLSQSQPIRPPDVVKIDVEGAEVLVLEGMSRVLSERRPVLIIEMHGKNAEVERLLNAAGYDVENLDGLEAVSRAPDTVHAIARPRAPS